MKPETLFRKKVVRWLKDNLKHCKILSLQQISLRGDPDLILCVNGLFVALEIKALGGKATTLQLHTLGAIREAGGAAFVVDPQGWDSIKSHLLYLDEIRR